jgi:hypothetical protein
VCFLKKQLQAMCWAEACRRPYAYCHSFGNLTRHRGWELKRLYPSLNRQTNNQLTSTMQSITGLTTGAKHFETLKSCERLFLHLNGIQIVAICCHLLRPLTKALLNKVNASKKVTMATRFTPSADCVEADRNLAFGIPNNEGEYRLQTSI